MEKRLIAEKHQGRSKGFTLIELMIAMTLGVIVIGGMYALFSVNKETIRVQSNLGFAQEQANYALEAIAREARMAGWPGIFSPNPAAPFAGAMSDAAGRYDVLVLSRRGLPFDCTGAVAPGGFVSHQYYVDNASKELRCLSLNTGDEIAMVDNVEAFQVLYGIDTTTGPCPNIDPSLSLKDANAECMAPTSYVRGDVVRNMMDAANVNFVNAGFDLQPGVADLVPIKTIQLAIVVSTEEPDIIDQAASAAQNYSLLSQNIPGATVNDGRGIRVAMRTVALRQAFRGP